MGTLLKEFPLKITEKLLFATFLLKLTTLARYNSKSSNKAALASPLVCSRRSVEMNGGVLIVNPM